MQKVALLMRLHDEGEHEVLRHLRLLISGLDLCKQANPITIKQ